MKSEMTVFCAAAFSAFCAAALEVGPREIAAVDVAEDTLQDSLVTIGPGGCLYKTGAGTWTLPFGVLGWEPELDIVVKEGALAVDVNDDEPLAVPCPSEVITAKALMWFDASLAGSRPSLFATRAQDGITYLDTLFDVRETDTSARTRPCAVAQHSFRYVKEGLADGNSANCATREDPDKVPSPEIVTRDGRTAIYFGGVGSGRKMAIRRAGKDTAESIKDVVHLFLVTDVVDGWGNPVSGMPSSGIWWGSAVQSLSNPLLSVDSSAWFLGNRTYVDGERIDPLSVSPKTGFQVFECELTAYKCTASAIYSGGSAAASGSCKIAADDDGSRATAVQPGGGDYMYEMIAFTNRLTGAERQLVAEYLRRKWTLGVSPRLRLGFADGTGLVLDTDTPMVNPVPRASRASLTKKGEGVLTVDRDKDSPALNYPEIELEGGSVDLKAPAAVKVAAGSVISAEYTDDASRVAVDAGGAAADALEKTGNGYAVIRTVPAAVRRIDVADGRLVVHPVGESRSDAVAADAGEYIDIPNAGFEDWSGTDRIGTWGNDFWTPWKGWTLLEGVTTKSSSYLFNYDNWKSLGAGWANNSLGTMAIKSRPHGGSCALMMRTSKTGVRGVMTREALTLAAGRYEFEYWSSCSGTRTGAIVDIVLVDEKTRQITPVGRQAETQCSADGYGLVRIRFDLADAGRYHLGFRNQPTGESAGDTTLLMTMVDDLRLRRVSSNDGRWAIPGGDMELLDYPNPGTMENRVFSTAVTHGAWTLVQPAGAEDATGTELGVGFATRYHHDQDASQCCYYNDSDSPYRTAMMTFFKSGSSARTTFTPPAGTWRLKARLAENGQTPVHSLSATATLGGETVSLGAVDPATKLLSEFRFVDGTIAVDGETPVTLTLAYSLAADVKTGAALAALYLDDLSLEAVDAVKDGCVELGRSDRDGNSSLSYSFVNLSDGDLGTAVDFTQYPSYAGDGYGGTSGYIVRNRGGLSFTHAFPGPGTYRFSFFANGVSTADGVNPLSVCLVDGTLTNLLGVVKARSLSQTEYAFTLRIPQSASYVRTLLVTGSNADGVDEDGEFASDAVVDNVSLAKVPDCDLVDTDGVFAADTEISVADGAVLELDFVGTNTVSGIMLGGRRVHGFIGSGTHPRYISGPGVLFAAPKGMRVIVR